MGLKFFLKKKKKKETDTQTNGTTENPETDPCKYSQLISDRGARQVKGGKTAFPTNGAGVDEHR